MQVYPNVAESLRAIFAPRTGTALFAPDSPHPLHALLNPLLLSAHSSSTKYHAEFPQILANNGSAGEIEETVMRYAFNYEIAGKGEEAGNSEDALRMEEKWETRGWNG